MLQLPAPPLHQALWSMWSVPITERSHPVHLSILSAAYSFGFPCSSHPASFQTTWWVARVGVAGGNTRTDGGKQTSSQDRRRQGTGRHRQPGGCWEKKKGVAVDGGWSSDLGCWLVTSACGQAACPDGDRSRGGNDTSQDVLKLRCPGNVGGERGVR
jgi:hypothetical protein